MSWKATGFVKDIKKAGNGEALTISEKFCLLILADSYLDDTHRTIATIPKLAGWLLLTERQTIRLVQSLERKKSIRVIRHRENGRPVKGRANEYQIAGWDDVSVSGDMGDMPNCHPNSGDIRGQNRVTLDSNSGDIGGSDRVTSRSKKEDIHVTPTKKLSTKKLSTNAAARPRSAPAASKKQPNGAPALLQGAGGRSKNGNQRKPAPEASQPTPPAEPIPAKLGTAMLAAVEPIISPDQRRQAERIARAAEREKQRAQLRIQAEQLAPDGGGP